MEINPIITIYNDFIDEYQKINAWTIYDSFPIKEIEKKSEVDGYAVIEVVYAGTHGDDSKYNKIRATFDSFLQKYLNSKNDKYKLLFQIGEIGLKSRIRSYKGIFGRSESSLEEEFDEENGYSIIEGVVNLDEQNQIIVKSYLFDRTKCFLIISDENMYSKDFLVTSYESIINKSSYTVDYIKVCKEFCNNNNIIVRESGDGGDQEFGWQLFINKKNVDSIKKDIEKILNI